MTPETSFDRRRLLAFLASLPWVGSYASAATAASESALDRGPVIDAHCHLFNASDLPTVRFLKRVILQKYPKEAVSVLDIGDPDALDGLLSLATWILGRAKAPTAQSEIRVLEEQLRPKGFAAQERESAGDIQDAVAAYYLDQTGPVAVGGPERTRGDGLVLGALLSAAGQKRGVAVSGAPPTRSTAKSTAKKAYDSKTDIGTYLRWFSLISRYRYQLADQLADDFERQGFKPKLLSPALVDYDLWLGEEVRRSSLTDQVEVMDRVSQRAEGPAVHGYVAYDPLRQVYWDQPKLREHARFSSLELVQHAVKDCGFLGVKLYPPMGFRPTGNGLQPQGYPDQVVADLGTVAVGAELDRALSGLYDLCTRLDIPILAHASHGNGAFADAADRADPAYWIAVFDRWPKLRVCLAHFGGFSAPSAAAPAGAVSPENSWEWTLGRYVAANPQSRVYADISYLAEVFAKPEARAKTAANIRAFVKAFDPKVEHLVFGSDWIMLGLQGGYPQYAGLVHDFFRLDCQFGADQMRRLFHGNAARFLGLERGSAGLKRMAFYYARNELPALRLRDLASAASSTRKSTGG
jgi:predicted TIM-barrel fold metal-dependent hydrolase